MQVTRHDSYLIVIFFFRSWNNSWKEASRRGKKLKINSPWGEARGIKGSTRESAGEMERKCSPEGGREARREGQRAAGPDRCSAEPLRPPRAPRGGHTASRCCPCPPGSLRVASLPPAPYGFSPPPPPFLPPLCCLRGSPHSTFLLHSPGERFPARPGPAESEGLSGASGQRGGASGTAWLGSGEGREEGASQNSKVFPGCALEELEEVHLPHAPPLLVFFFLSPTPSHPPAATRNTRHSEINIIHLHQKKEKTLASYKLAADPPLRLVFSRSCIMSVK